MSDLLPLVGFGDPDDPATFAPFHVETDPDSGVYPDWEPEPNRTVRQIARSDDFDVYVGGWGPSRLTLAVWFDDVPAYRRLRSLYRLSTPGTLSLLAAFTSHEGPIRTHLGRDYEQYRDTLIDAIRAPRFPPDGRVECTVTFLRSEPAP